MVMLSITYVKPFTRKNKMAAAKTEVACKRDSEKIQTAMPMFSRTESLLKLTQMSYSVSGS